MPQKLGSRQLVQRFAQAAGADLQTLNQAHQATRSYLADLSQRVDRVERGAYDINRDAFVSASDALKQLEALRAFTEHFTSRTFWQRVKWMLTGR